MFETNFLGNSLVYRLHPEIGTMSQQKNTKYTSITLEQALQTIKN